MEEIEFKFWGQKLISQWYLTEYSVLQTTSPKKEKKTKHPTDQKHHKKTKNKTLEKSEIYFLGYSL